MGNEFSSGRGEGTHAPNVEWLGTKAVSPASGLEHQHSIPPKSTFRDIYRLDSRIGTGSHSQVFRAINRFTGVAVAVKAIATDRLDRRRLEFLRREIAILREVSSHPFIVRLLGVFEDAEGCFIVQELAEGGNLLSLIHGRTSLYTEEEVRPMLWRVLVAAKFLHDRGIIHRDIKPENMLVMALGDTNSIKIADFGFALRLTPEPSAPEACGTPEFVSPEVLLKIPFDGRADVWSIGVTAFCLLGGTMPFVGLSLDGLFKSILKGAYSFRGTEWQCISGAAKDFISCMLKVDQQSRWTAAKLLEHPWFRGAGFASMMSSPHTNLRVGCPPLRGSRGFRIAGMALLFVCALVRGSRRKKLAALLPCFTQNKGGEVPEEDFLEMGTP